MGHKQGYEIEHDALSQPTVDRPDRSMGLFEHEELYRAVVENVADGIAITVNAERVFVNKAFLTIHGLRDASDVVGHPLDQFVLPEDREAVRQRNLARQRGERPDDVVEYRIKRPDGEVRTVQVSVVAATYQGQAATLAVLRDVTAIKRAEREIIRLNQELRQKVVDLKNANDELEAFNATVSHDLRNPLLVIKGFCDMITRKYGGLLDEAFVEKMAGIRESARKMEQLIDLLLGYARLGRQALQQSPVDMNALAQSVVNDLRPLYPEGDVIISPLARCIGDAQLLRQVFINLVSNAFKFTSHQARRVIEIGCTQGSTETVFFVRDNGAGFDMQHRDRLFNVFQRLHSNEEFNGTGMGLAIVKRIVSLHGGTVWAEGRPGKGASFYLSIPHRRAS